MQAFWCFFKQNIPPISSFVMAVIFCFLLPIHRKNLKLTQKSRDHDLWLVRYSLHLEVIQFWDDKEWPLKQLVELYKVDDFNFDLLKKTIRASNPEPFKKNITKHPHVISEAARTYVLAKLELCRKVALIFGDQDFADKLCRSRSFHEFEYHIFYNVYYTSKLHDSDEASKVIWRPLHKLKYKGSESVLTLDEIIEYFDNRLKLKD